MYKLMCFDIRTDEEGDLSKKVFWSEKASTAGQKKSMFEVNKRGRK